MRLDSAFFCSTPYQLLAAMSIVKDTKEESDLYILTQFDNAEKYAKQIKKASLFARVRLINDDYIKSLFIKDKLISKLHLSMVLSFVFTDSIVKKILFEDTEYSKIYFSSKAYILRLIEFYYEKIKSSVEKIYFEDGIGTYSSFTNINSLRERDYAIKNILSPSWNPLRCDKLFVYSPKVYKSLNQGSKYNIHQIINLCNTDMDLVNKIFGVDKEIGISESVILLDTIPTEVFDADNTKRYHSIVQQIVRIIGNDNVTVKRHPRDISHKNNNYHYYEKDSIPFEVVIANSNMDNKVLISYFSTAIVTPKLLFNQEPYVILLNNLVRSKIKVSDEIVKCFDEIKKLYRDKTRFIVPNNETELIEALKICKSKLVNDEQ